MESYKIENLSFTYPNRKNKAIDDISFTVSMGEFITICGKSGCGKTTLLRMLKSVLAPHGDKTGNIYFENRKLTEISSREQAAKIGFVMQNPDNQIVTDKVWHELAFGLESLGYSTPEIRARVSEMASFFGIQTWFHKKVTDLSGGQKQLLNLASVMVMQPSVLILDEPTSQLDPIAAQEFLNTLKKINTELGITVILSEHRIEDAFAMADRVIVMDKGRITADSTPREVGEILKRQNHPMYMALPTPMRIHGAVDNDLLCPVTVRDGKCWLENYSKEHSVDGSVIPKDIPVPEPDNPVIQIKDAHFRYEKNLPDVIKGLNVSVNKGEIFAMLGGNGAGKTTALSLVSRLNKPYRGEILINGEPVSKIQNLYNGIMGVLPQNPQSVFVKKTVYLDLLDILSQKKLSKEEKEFKIKNISQLCRIEDLLDSHPYDLSGGEQQRAALAKVMLMSPQILLLDEPTKGLDAHFKHIFADILKDLKAKGITVVMVSHDIEFCAEFADRCAMFFDGGITSIGTPREFFAGKSFYTTSANRIARTTIPNAVLADDIILACGGKTEKKEYAKASEIILPKEEIKEKKKLHKKASPLRIVCGFVFVLLFILTSYTYITDVDLSALTNIKWITSTTLQFISIAEAAVILFCFLPQREIGISLVQTSRGNRKLTKRTIVSALLILIAIPLTIFVGMFYLQDRKYYFISLLIILETMIPFCMAFESRGPQARELVIISVLCAIAVAGRATFFMVPQFKPVVALVIIAGVCFGGETGFLVGAVTGFVSNFFFGQGPWTPWQMFAFGIIGFIAGITFKKGFLRKTKASLCIFGAIAAVVLYGGIMNPATVVLWQDKPTAEMIVSAYVMGFPFDLLHAVSTVFFLWFISEPMIDKLERIKLKYGLIEEL